MPTELLQRVMKQLDYLYPPFLEKVLAVLAECRARGVDYYILGDGAYRSYAEQAKIYAQGRTTPGAIVTHARPGYSAHNYGLAVDCARDADLTRAGLQPRWGQTDYDLLGEVAQQHGLVWGGKFHRVDRPHIQWPGYVTGRELDLLRAVMLDPKIPDADKLRRVWQEVARE